MTIGSISSSGRIARLREQRRYRRIMGQLDKGQWRDVLIGLDKTQHRYRAAMRHNGEIADLLVKVNLISLALDLHADVVAGNPARVTVPEEFEGQRQAIERMRRACLFNTLLHRAVRRLYRESEAALRVTFDNAGRTVICLDSNSETIPVGPRGADGQPEYWERRWIIERESSSGATDPDRFLRVERHRAGVIEQEAYKVDGSGAADVLIDLAGAEKVPLAVALGMREDSEGVPEPETETGVPYPLIVSLYGDLTDGEPGFLFKEGDLDLLDMTTASVSRLSREHEQHAGALLAVPEEAVDRDTGAVDVGSGALVDPGGKAHYITKDLRLADMLGMMDRCLTLTMQMLRVSPALLGARLGGGSTPDTYDKLRLEATQTLSRGRQTAAYVEPAIERLIEIASIVEARRDFAGFPVSPVSAVLTPEIPKDSIDRAREQSELLREGLTSSRRAVIAVHGEDIADEVLDEIASDRSAAAEAQRTALFDAVPPIGEPEVTL